MFVLVDMWVGMCMRVYVLVHMDMHTVWACVLICVCTLACRYVSVLAHVSVCMRVSLF